MSALDVLSKEIDEAYKSVASQHDQIKYYFQIYMAALAGLFTLTGYFSSGGITRDEAIIGIISTVSVFCLGWIFLSIVAHKVSMLIFLYKHLAVCRAKRLDRPSL